MISRRGNTIPQSVHEEVSAVFTGKPEEAYREYLITGGMPEVDSIIPEGVDVVLVEVNQQEGHVQEALQSTGKKIPPAYCCPEQSQ